MDLKRLETFFDISLALLCTAEAGANRFKDLNPAWEATLGWSLDELRARPFTEFIHPEDLQPTFDVITDMVDRGLPAVNFENRYLHKDGHWVWLSWVGVIRDGMFYSSARDISAYKANTEELKRAHDELSQFAYAASHDLQEPLRAITGYLGAVDSSDLDDRSQRAMDHVRDGARHMQRLIDGLVAISRVGVDGRELLPLDLNRVVSDTLRLLKASLDETAAEVDVQGPLPTVLGDDVQLVRVFQNVIGNAIKYRKPFQPPKVTIRAVDGATSWLVEVRDEGIGIVSERAERAFQMFQRLHRRSQYPGMGVGLALCRRIIERHGGQIHLVGAPDAGCTVSLRFPKPPPVSRAHSGA